MKVNELLELFPAVRVFRIEHGIDWTCKNRMEMAHDHRTVAMLDVESAREVIVIIEDSEADTMDEITASDDGVAALVDVCTRAWNEYYRVVDDALYVDVSFNRAEAKAFAMADALETVTGKLWSYEQNDRRMFVCD